MPSPLLPLALSKEESADPSGACPAHFSGEVAEQFVLHGDVITLLERDFRPELAAVTGDVGEQDREALAVGSARDSVEIHMTPEFS